jgi:Xaa-Pro aminopeptidase
MKGICMAFAVDQNHDFSINALRRRDLVNGIREEYRDKTGIIVIFAGFEGECRAFRQESSFYYLTGISEPGIVLVIDLNGKSTLYVPNCGPLRSKWVFSPIELIQENAKKLGIDEITVLGIECVGYQFHPFFPKQEYDFLLQRLQKTVTENGNIFTLYPTTPHEYSEQRLFLGRLESFMPGLSSSLIDVADIVAHQRRIKDMREIELIYAATEITSMAHEAAAQAIRQDVLECEVQASIEYIFTASGGTLAFPSIVASGKNSTVLHYQINNGTLKNGDLVVIDIGAEYAHYCSDLTRTYPVSGKFTKRQREIYDLVLETQEYIASLAKPGYWLNNKEVPEKSLNHLARAYLAKKGFDKYFIHGIGHYLGLDVHDVGDYKKPLQEGDVFTIEPGIYIPEESLGVRIEDDYWVVKDGVVCLSENLPKKAQDIERLMAQEFESSMTFEEEADEETISQA